MTAREKGDSWAGLRVCVVGAGYMGSGIAQVLAGAGAEVRLVDVDPARAAGAVQAMHRQAEEFERQQLMPAGAAQTIVAHSRAADGMTDGCADVDLMIEAVVEDPAVKHRVLAAAEAAAPAEAVFASNTSAIPIAVLAQALADRGRLLGMHWFNPAQFVPGVEIIAGPNTRPGLVEWLQDLLIAAGKWPAVVQDSPGFVANRLQFALFREAVVMLEEGVASASEIDAIVKGTFGYRLPFYGPFEIADMAGLDVYAGAYETLGAALGERFAAPRLLGELVGQGRLGVKSGGGFLDLTPEQTRAMIQRRDRCYVALRAIAEPDALGPEPARDT